MKVADIVKENEELKLKCEKTSEIIVRLEKKVSKLEKENEELKKKVKVLERAIEILKTNNNETSNIELNRVKDELYKNNK
jgi:cell division protein FtsB